MSKKFLLLTSFIFFCYHLTNAQVIIDTEGGIAFQGYNHVRVPGQDGTLFHPHKDFNTSSTPYFRIKAGFRIHDKHNILVLIAPLTLKSSGIAPYNIDFHQTTFNAGEVIHFRYRFDSYRLTYRYDILHTEDLRLGVGATLKIRDAAIRMSSTSMFSEKSNIGLVPLLSAYFNATLYRDWGILLEADALAAPQGRAEDIQAAITYELASIIRLKAGYRLLEGGVNSAEVYNFSMVHYLMTGLLLNF